MKTAIKIFATAVISIAQAVVPTFARAAQTFTACDTGSVIFYINGVNKPNEQEVGIAARKLHAKLTLYASGQGVKDVLPLFNPSDGLMMDVLSELARQKAGERNAAFADMFVQVGLAAWGFVSSLSKDDQDQIRARVAGAVGSSALKTSSIELIEKFRGQVVETLNNGNKTILLGHSQGNMFANEVYDSVRANQPQNVYKGLAVVNVANPASRAPSNLYVTIVQDLVINLLARGQAVGLTGQLPTYQPMLPNFDAGIAALGKDATGHGFTEVYMAADLPNGAQVSASVFGRVADLISQAITLAQTPNRTTTDGPITATLSWGGVGDVDLHVFEPQGSHVYFMAKQGADGYLDLDNMYGFGPEHYYTSCTNFGVGIYRFGVSYFGGDIPQTATLTIKTPSGSRNTTVLLPQAVGFAGADSPLLLFGVVVLKQADGIYSFTTVQY